MLRIHSAISVRELGQVRDLFIEYSNSLEFDLSFQDFQKELDDLPGDYAAPSGRLLLGFYDSDPAGCVALRRISDEICEMKRLFLRPQCRGLGIGKALATKVIEEARRLATGECVLTPSQPCKPQSRYTSHLDLGKSNRTDITRLKARSSWN